MKKNEQAHVYPISITGRHLSITEAMKKHAKEKLARLEHLSKDILDIHVTMDIQREDNRVDIMVKTNRFVIKTHATSSDMYASIDKATEKLIARLSKFKAKMQEHHAKSLSQVTMDVDVVRSGYSEVAEINDEIEEANFQALAEDFSHQIVKQETLPLKTLTYAEAVMKMDLSGDHFMVFRSEEEQKIKVIYRREEDGHYGVIAPQ